MSDEAKVYHSCGLVGNREFAEYYVEGGSLAEQVDAYLRVLDWRRWWGPDKNATRLD